jgi:hypothetical protein
MRMRQFLPGGLFSFLDRLTKEDGPTESQLERIKLLGEDVGLGEDDVLAALEPSSGPLGFDSQRRPTLYLSYILILVVVTIGVLVVWTIVDPESSPIKTYLPGTLYGTVRPDDFTQSTQIRF